MTSFRQRSSLKILATRGIRFAGSEQDDIAQSPRHNPDAAPKWGTHLRQGPYGPVWARIPFYMVSMLFYIVFMWF